jgi:hypothetical protein
MSSQATKRYTENNQAQAQGNTNALVLTAADRAFVERDILILGILHNAAQRAVASVVSNNKTSVRTAEKHLDALMHYLEEVAMLDFPTMRRNGLKCPSLPTLFPSIHRIQLRAKHLRRQLNNKAS